jgi:hypothetical protein
MKLDHGMLHWARRQTFLDSGASALDGSVLPLDRRPAHPDIYAAHLDCYFRTTQSIERRLSDLTVDGVIVGVFAAYT